MILTHDRNGQITYANSKVFQLSGYSQAELYAKSFTDLIPQKSRQTVLEQGEMLWLKDQPQTIFETALVSQVGQSMQVEVIASPVYANQKLQAY